MPRRRGSEPGRRGVECATGALLESRIAWTLDPDHADVVNTALGRIKAEKADLEARLKRVEDCQRAREQVHEVVAALSAQLTAFPHAWALASNAERKASSRAS